MPGSISDTDPLTSNLADGVGDKEVVSNQGGERPASTAAGTVRELFAEQGINLEVSKLNETIRHRFIRLNPRFPREIVLSQLKNELQNWRSADGSVDYPIAIPWMDADFGFFAVPAGFPLAQSQSYAAGRVYGQDVSSGAAVAALLTDRYDEKTSELSSESDSDVEAVCTTGFSTFRILDLCCSPGLKLCAIADWLSSRGPKQDVTLVGVDVAPSRMALCKRVVHKYFIHPETSGPQKEQQSASTSPLNPTDNNYERSRVHIQLFCNDGTSFGSSKAKDAPNLSFDSNQSREDALFIGKRKRMNKSARTREQKRLKEIMSKQSTVLVERTDCLFDAVLVDAECSTDGSVKHLQKKLEKLESAGISYAANGSELCPKLADSRQLSELVGLQKGLISNGFQLLRNGGLLVYSTCSLSSKQNEEVVEWLLEANPSRAKLVSIDAMAFGSDSIAPGSLPGTVRFLPKYLSSSNNCADIQDENLVGGGFFLAKIQKRLPD